MNPEDRLRELLRDGEPSVGAGSFDDVRARARRRARRARVARAGAGLVAVLALVGVAVPLLDDDEAGQQVIAEPGPTASSVPTTTVPDEGAAAGIWPFVTAAEADDEELGFPFNPTDAGEVAHEFLVRFAGMDAAVEPATSQGHEVRTVTVVARTRVRETSVILRRLGESDRWTVVGAHADGLVLEAPLPGDAAGGSVAVRGRATAFEGTVLVEVLDRADPPAELGRAVLTGEQGELRPFVGEVAVEVDDPVLGVVVATTESAEDGSVEQVAAVAVRLQPEDRRPPDLPAGAPLADGEIVAVLTEDVPDDPDRQDVVLLGTERGEVRRTILADIGTAEGGVLDLEVSPDRRSVLVAISTSACESEVRAYAAHPSGGTGHRVLGAGERVALSPDGEVLASVVYDACGESATVELRDLRRGAVVDRLEVGRRIEDLAWWDEETLVYGSQGRLWELPSDDREQVESRPEDQRTSWSQPTGGPGGPTVVVRCCGSEPEESWIDSPGPRRVPRNRTDDRIVSHAARGSELVWVTDDGRLVDGGGRVIRRGVALVAS